MSAPATVLVVTGSLLVADDPSPLGALRRQVDTLRASSGAWLDTRVKLQAAQGLLAVNAWRKSAGYRKAAYRPTIDRLFAPSPTPPELTEVLLAGLLEAEGFTVRTTTWAALDADERALDGVDVVFASTTLLRDLSELLPLAARLARPGLRVVAGGALTAILHDRWPGVPGIDVVAVGYGEWLVPALADWIRSGFTRLNPPPRGHLAERGGTPIVYSGLPDSLSLDDLPSPDWAGAVRRHGPQRLAYYESVRGCPYRCAFCNYPFLFADTKFRTRSAARIAADWAELARLGVEVVSCLDSLFTMPRRRLVELCERLVALGTPVRWICYARADDLDPDTAALMARAGAIQVQIGLESGSQAQLDRMQKRVTVEANAAALAACRDAGITSLCTVIVGYPGETRATLEETVAFLRRAPPDVYYLAPFNTRVEDVPVLSPASRERFGIRTAPGSRSSAPYWRHATMGCAEVAPHMAWMHEALRGDRVALDGMLFYAGLLRYTPADRADALAFQADALGAARGTRAALGALERWAQGRLERAVEAAFPTESGATGDAGAAGTAGDRP